MCPLVYWVILVAPQGMTGVPGFSGNDGIPVSLSITLDQYDRNSVQHCVESDCNVF